jgi:hypothetical protein
VNHPALQRRRGRLVGRQALPLGCREGDLLQSANRVLLAYRQRDEQDADQIPV